MTCRKCGGKMKQGIVLVDTPTPGIDDFGGDGVGVTMYMGPAKLPPKPCLKCEECGYSLLPGKHVFDPPKPETQPEPI